MTGADDYEARSKACAARAASKLDLNNLDLDERAFLGTCQDIYRANVGCYTPFESFFCDLARFMMWGNAPTPDIIRKQLEDAGNCEFIANWEPMLYGVKRFLQNYPDLAAELQTAAKGEAEQPLEAAHAKASA